VLSGQAAGHYAITVIVWFNAALLAAAAFVALHVPQLLAAKGTAEAAAIISQARSVGALLGSPSIAGWSWSRHWSSEATRCTTALRWSAGVELVSAQGTSGLLWSLSVAAEVIVFFFVGRPLLDRMGPAGAAMLSAGAGIVRWAVMAETAWLPAAIEPLHGLTFGLLHLTCMRLLAESVPRHLEATGLTIYGNVAIGIATVLLTVASGPVFDRFGAHGFWAMAALCAAALPFARTLRDPAIPA
jgi:PPP family 3-phenylpropionic acid transporter